MSDPGGVSVLMEELDDPLDAVDDHGHLLGVVREEVGKVAKVIEGTEKTKAMFGVHGVYMRGIAEVPATYPFDPSKTLERAGA